MDGKILPRTQLEQGISEPPFHPNCRCTTVPYDEDWDYKGQRIAKDDNGNDYYVPEDMSYEEWKRKFVDGEKLKGLNNKIEDIPIYRSVGAKAQNYKVKNTETGEFYNFVEGTKIQNAEVFAGYKSKKSLREEVAQGLAERYGGSPEKWQHSKGIGIIDDNGEERRAEVHWFQEESVGKVGFKVKWWLDED